VPADKTQATLVGPLTPAEGTDVMWQSVHIDTGYKTYGACKVFRH
jgi:hypothetical protein